jgi:glucokinase
VKIGDEAVRALESSLVRQMRIGDSVSRSELAKRMELAPSTVGQYVDRLIDSGFLREGRKVVLPAGRPPTVLELNPAAGQFVGVDFEARQLWVTVVDFAQQPLGESKVPIRSSDTADHVLAKIEHAIAEALSRRGPLLGIGVGVPGAVDPQRGIGVHYEFIRGWNDVPLRQRLTERFRVPVHLENNIRAMALAEELFGHGRGVSDFVCVGIRSGIGAGIVVDGRLHTGPSHLAGEIGGWPCGRGSTLEQRASISSLIATLETAARKGQATSLELRRDRLMLDDVLRVARNGDALVLRALRRMGQTIGEVFAQLNLLLNPQRIIIGGPLASFEAEFVQVVRETVEPSAASRHATMPVIVGSQLGEFAGALGGAALAARHWSPAKTGSAQHLVA